MIPVKGPEFTAKQETNTNESKTVASSSSTTTSWSRLKDPRIVRVSRAFGGKDRHSKVCTVKGLRDRRVRLSAPTAIQLYDLQYRLGLNQPSKVVDWLLNVAKHEIDELPPLQIPQGLNFGQNTQTSHEIIRASQLAKQGLKISDIVMNSSNDVWGKETSYWREENWEERQFQENNQGSYFTSSNNFISRPNLLLNNISTTPYNPFVRWDTSNLTLSQQQDDHRNLSLVPSGSNQVLVYHQNGTTSLQSYLFPSQNDTTSSNFTERQPHFENWQLSSNSTFTSHADSTITPNVRPFHFSMAENFIPRNEQNKDEFH